MSEAQGGTRYTGDDEEIMVDEEALAAKKQTQGSEAVIEKVTGDYVGEKTTESGMAGNGREAAEEQRKGLQMSEGLKMAESEKITTRSVDEQTAENLVFDNLPPRLFATDQYPVDDHINSYSKPDYLIAIKEILEGSLEFEWVKSSWFGRLLELPIRNCSFSGKLVHQFLCRSLVTQKRHELWFVFDEKPIRFSLREFGMLTGLNCKPLPKKREIDAMQQPPPGEEEYWYTLIGRRENYKILDIVNILKRDKLLLVLERMSGERRLKLALIVLVEGILTCESSKVRATHKIVEMVRDLDQFVNFPWGRKSFDLSLEVVQTGDKIKGAETLANKLAHSHIATHGFTLAIQLLILKAVPMLENLLPNPDDNTTFMDCPVTQQLKLRTFHNPNIIEVERATNLKVMCVLERGCPVEDIDFVWKDEVEDPAVECIHRKVASGHVFKNEDWTGGIDDFPLITAVVPKNTKEAEQVEKRSTKEVSRRRKKVGKRQGTEKAKVGGSTETRGGIPEWQEDILKEVERMMNAQTTKIIELFQVERCLLKDELYDELKRDLKNEDVGKNECGISIPPMRGGCSGGKKDGWTEYGIDVPAILKSINRKCTSPAVGADNASTPDDARKCGDSESANEVNEEDGGPQKVGQVAGWNANLLKRYQMVIRNLTNQQ